MKTVTLQLICLGAMLIGFATCKTEQTTPPDPGAIIETAIPNGLVPGSALTLKGRDFLTVTSVQFANVSVAAGSFIRKATNELTLKVPLNAQTGPVSIVNEKGTGQAKQMTLLTGSYGLTVDNVSTSVGGITQGNVLDDCSPYYFLYCYNKACIGYYRSNKDNLSQPRCQTTYYTLETIAGSSYEVFKPIRSSYQQVTLKFELKQGGAGYTGLVLLNAPNGDEYTGSILKDGSIVGYSPKDASQIKLCKPSFSNFAPTSGRLCPDDGNGCSTCQ